MDGQCQDEFLHCTEPGPEQERVNITFRWIRQHVASFLLRAGVACCPPTCTQGWSFPVTTSGVGGGGGGGGGGEVFFFDFLVPPWGSVHSGDAGFAGFFLFCVQGLGYEGLPSLWGGQHQRYPQRCFWLVQKYTGVMFVMWVGLVPFIGCCIC